MRFIKTVKADDDVCHIISVITTNSNYKYIHINIYI